jgi:hypothetical protein
MASIRRQGSRFEIRECRDTPEGPRQRTLARFDRILTPEVLDQAAARAQRSFDRKALVQRARQQGIPSVDTYRSDDARRLIAALREGRSLQPSVVGLLQEALAALDSRPLPPHLEDAAEWLGASEAARGKALRGLLRSASRALRSRGPLRTLEEPPFPRFSSAEPN